MNLQDIVEMADQIKELRQARDLLREVQWWAFNESMDFPKELQTKIDTYFNYDSERGM